MASIERRKTSKGEPRYEVRYRTPDGTERSRTFPTRRKAETYAAIAEADKARGSWIDPRDANLTLREVADRWLASNPTKRPTTVATDELMLRVHILPKLGRRRVGFPVIRRLIPAGDAESAVRESPVRIRLR